MRFVFRERHIDELRMWGSTVFPGIVAAALLTDLRCCAEQALQVARQISGAQAQRLGNVTTHAGINAEPLRE